MWMAGGGTKGGTIYGATDDFGFKVADKPVHVHDLHATILHLMGIDHTKLTYYYSGARFPSHNVAGKSSPGADCLISGEDQLPYQRSAKLNVLAALR
jgi:hypothetical protein